MSPQNPPLIVGLAASGLFWLATSVAPGQEAPPALPGPATPPPTSSRPASKTFRALLLSNGKVIRGEIVEDAGAGLYQLRQNGGVVGYPRLMVQKAGQSVQDLYEYQLSRLPGGDPDERMKLARWCLTEKLADHAKEQLEAILAMCPGDAEVQRMLYNLASTADRPGVDPGVRRTSVDLTRDEAPASLDPRVVGRAQKRFNALPEIFGLPQAQAVKRANEFADYVQPVLQASCARCHNEKYQGEFQLVTIKTRKDQTNPDIARANLDATLRLINADDPSQSRLLSSGLVPHDGSKSAVFKGPNDKSYQVLSTWTKSLRPSSKSSGASRGLGDGANRAGLAPSEGEAFGSDRPDRAGSMPKGPRGGPPPSTDRGFANRPSGVSMPPKVISEQYEESAEFINAPGDRPVFEVPPVIAGLPPSPPVPASRTRATSKKAPGPVDPSGLPPIPPSSKKTARQVAPGAVVVESTGDPNELVGMDQPRYPPKREADSDDDESSKVKPKPIDNALLERMMRNRNGGTP